ncbi:unnamed protein product [Ixodes hexagonus]
MASFRQTEERNVSGEVDFMLWSPKLDLIALALVQGQVALHRLSRKRVWLRAPPGGKEQNKIKVQSLAWRPDGKILAIAYDTGTLILCNVENADIVHTIEVAACISTLSWASDGSSTSDVGPRLDIYKDVSKTYLPNLPSLNKTYGASTSSKSADENVDDSKMLKHQDDFNILVVGTVDGRVLLYAYGVLLCAEFETEVASYTGDHTKKIVSTLLSDRLGRLTLVVESKCGIGKCLYLQSYSVATLRDKSRELQVVALKYGQITSLFSYLTATVGAIREAWEDILLEIDSKLVNYAQEKHRTSSGTVSDDFLELLMFGTPSDALEKFLLHDLTEKGLKKLGHSIDLCYCNIQKYVLKHLQSVTEALYFHFCDLQGMARWQERFGTIGLSKAAVADVLQCTGAFLMKLMELLQVIDSSMRNFRAFFRWLYAVILRLSDDPVPVEVTRVTQQDINFVAEFLKENFAVEWDEANRSSFSLERVGQYLKDEPLTFPLQVQNNVWCRFLDENPGIKNSGLLVPHNLDRSLVQEHSHLEKAVGAAFVGPADALGRCAIKESQVMLTAVQQGCPSAVSHVVSAKGECVYTSFVPALGSGRDIYIVRHLGSKNDFSAIRVFFDRFPNAMAGESRKHVVLDAQFYNEETLSVLLSEETAEGTSGMSILVQLSLKNIQSHFHPMPLMSDNDVLTELNLCAVDAAKFLDKMNFRHLENMRAASFAVSGARHVVCVLFQSRRRVRTFEMDVEEEEGEEEDSLSRDKDMTDLQDEDKENSF